MIIKPAARYYYVFILANKEKNIFHYGATGDWSLSLKKWKELQDAPSGNDCIYLIYFEKYEDAVKAVNRELEIRSLSGKKRDAMIKSVNPNLDVLNEKAKAEFEIIL